MRIKTEKIYRFVFPSAFLILGILVLFDFFMREEALIRNESCEFRDNRFIVRFTGINKTAENRSLDVKIIVSRLQSHGRGAETWDPVSEKIISITMFPGNNTYQEELEIQVPFLDTPIPVKQFQVDVLMLRTIESK